MPNTIKPNTLKLYRMAFVRKERAGKLGPEDIQGVNWEMPPPPGSALQLLELRFTETEKKGIYACDDNLTYVAMSGRRHIRISEIDVRMNGRPETPDRSLILFRSAEEAALGELDMISDLITRLRGEFQRRWAALRNHQERLTSADSSFLKTQKDFAGERA